MSGSELRAWMVATGWTRQQLAAVFRVTPGLVDFWLNGTVRIRPSVARLVERGTPPRHQHHMTRPQAKAHTPACPREARCRACNARRAWQEGRQQHRRPSGRGDRWTAAEVERLRALAGSHTIPEISARLRAEFGFVRSEAALRTRAALHHISLQLGGAIYTKGAVARQFGVSRQMVLQWIQQGWLTATRSCPRKAAWYVIRHADLVAFIDDHPERYVWRKMLPGPLRRRAEHVASVDPVYTAEEVAQLYRIGPKTVYGALRRGELRGVLGSRATRAWLVRRSALLAWQRQRLPRWQRRAS